jgi:predicted Zn-dependent protease
MSGTIVEKVRSPREPADEIGRDAIPPPADLASLRRELRPSIVPMPKAVEDAPAEEIRARLRHASRLEVASPSRETLDFLDAATERALRYRGPVRNDPELTAYVQGVVDRLDDHRARKEPPLKVVLIESDDVAAAAAANGTIVVHTGLLERLENEGQLAGVLAHEICHIDRQHALKKAALVRPLANELGLPQEGRSLDELNLAVDSALMKPEHREYLDAVVSGLKNDEREADVLGLSVMVQAGYAPRDMIQGLEIVLGTDGELSNSRTAVSPTSVHPDDASRLRALTGLVKTRSLDRFNSNDSGAERYREAVKDL